MGNTIDVAIDKVLAGGRFGTRGKPFVFRAGQRDIIRQIIMAYLGKQYKAVILDAPTGSGKSIMAMFASIIHIASKVGGPEATDAVKEKYAKGYIVTSDIELQKQYTADFVKFRLGWGCLKGKDNYVCDCGPSEIPMGGKAPVSKTPRDLNCLGGCEYFAIKEHAEKADVTLMNYALWLKKANGFGGYHEKREFVFFDEAHKIDSLVQDSFCVEYPPKLHETAAVARTFAVLKDVGDYPGDLPMPSDFTGFYGEVINGGDNKGLLDTLKSLMYCLEDYVNVQKELKKSMVSRFGDSVERAKNNTKIPAEWRDADAKFNRLRNMYNTVCCYIKDIGDDADNIVKIKETDNGKPVIKLKNLNEAALIRHRLIDKSPFSVFMSATIGDADQFMEVMGIEKKDTLCLKMASTFDFSRSPIYQMGDIRLNWKQKAANTPLAIKMVDRIIGNNHKGQRGVVHTVSYELTQALLDGSAHKDRFITYRGSASKSKAMERLRSSPDGILVGPSVTEGIDLPDDMCRFQVLLKVPYPSLGDPFVKAKMKRGGSWYRWKTVNTLLQAVGRSNRHDNDWSTVYLIDGCYNDIIWTGRMPAYFSSRLVNVQVKGHHLNGGGPNSGDAT